MTGRNKYDPIYQRVRRRTRSRPVDCAGLPGERGHAKLLNYEPELSYRRPARGELAWRGGGSFGVEDGAVSPLG